MLSVQTVFSFAFSQALVWGPLALGHELARRGRVAGEIAAPIHRALVTTVVPLLYALGVWKLDRSGAAWWHVPLVYALMLGCSAAIAFTLSPRLFRDRRAVGTHIMLVGISNIGQTLAGFLTILLIGAHAYPLNAILMLPACIFIFLLWFPAASHYGGETGGSLGGRYLRMIFSPLSMPLLGIVAGLALNFSGTQMPGWMMLALKIGVFAGTALTMFAIGCRLRLHHVLRFARALRWLYLVKFLAHPAIAVGFCLLFGMHGVPAAVVFIAAIMPSGVMAVQFATIKDLDVDLANAGFLLSTAAFMLIVLPVMILLLQLPLFS